MKKTFVLVILPVVFCLGLGIGVLLEKGQLFSGQAVASSLKPTVTSTRVVEFKYPRASHRWGIFIETDHAIDVVELKNATKAALYIK